MTSPTGATLDEAQAFLAAHPDVQGIDVIITDLHGIARGKIIRRHELESLFRDGRGLPQSIFAQDIVGNDCEAAMALHREGGGDGRCWPVPGTLGMVPATDRAIVLATLHDEDGTPDANDPRQALITQIERAKALGFTPKGALELEFYLIDPARDGDDVLPAEAPLTGQRPTGTNTLSVDELDAMSPFLDAVYESARALDLPLETVISEYAEGQFELTLRYRDLARAVDDLILAKRILRTTARRHGMDACFLAKPYGDKSGSGMHLHLSLASEDGQNLFADQPDGSLSPLMLSAIGGIRTHMADTMLTLAPVLNSWRRFGNAVYSPASNSWGKDDRFVALRVPPGAPENRHFEHRVAGVDANPYLAATAILGSALNGIETRASAGTPGLDGATDHDPLPRSWLAAIDAFEASPAMIDLFGSSLHQSLSILKREEYEMLASQVTDVEWRIYGAVL
jgi:glutamine synthetase